MTSIYDDGAAETNKTRARWALIGLEAFGNETGQQYGYESLDVGEDVLGEVGGDFIANLLHLARLNGMEPEELVRRGYGHFWYEVAEEEEEAKEDAADCEENAEGSE